MYNCKHISIPSKQPPKFGWLRAATLLGIDQAIVPSCHFMNMSALRKIDFAFLLLCLACFGIQLAQALRLAPMCKTRQRFSLPMSSVDDFHSVQLISNLQEAEGLRLVTIQVPDPIAAGYVKAGQYVKVRNTKDGLNTQKPSFFAIASPPDQRGTLSFLIKETTNNEALFQGSGLEMSFPLGNGFNIEESFEVYKRDFPVNRIFIFCTGAGIAPIASVLDSQILGLGKVCL